MQARPYRSALYIPGSKPRALDKARGLEADAILFDLEDAVAPEEKPAARETLVAELSAGGYGSRARIVRINALDTEWGRDDAVALRDADCDAVLLPKVTGPGDIDRLANLLPGRPVWAMMETPACVFAAFEIARHPRLEGFVMGTNDLAKDLGARVGADRAELQTALQTCLLAARAAGIVAFDGVYNAFRDEEGLRRECDQGRALGFDGKSVIHPAQLPVTNRVFSPSEEEIDLAERQIAAYEEAGRQGQAVAVVDGSIVENLHVATARATLAKADAIRDISDGTRTPDGRGD
ncbi:HpcH/HpaI aldolase/citrate lyase family protein [Histidinibacterium aquaticum]|uniref:CoA ester lyase n=1 Tax=Histidinibacterium aquaticum TaxID=2613962 RepID=A0A5J5GBE9_9RHOB|nr:CoA ester lyase [Histidinibacterium aquaticum]KAA9005233.1 CoA ester lyase [Histidinibacterium aquaticum]